MMGWTQYLMPLLILLIGGMFLIGGERAARAFFSGAADGLRSVVSLLPTLLLFVCATSLFRASGAMEMLCGLLAPICTQLHIDAALVPLLLFRPLSGGASTAMLSELFSVYGPDSPIGLRASVLCGASETVLYVIAVYCGGRKMRYRRQIFFCSAVTAVFLSVMSLLLGGWLLGSP